MEHAWTVREGCLLASADPFDRRFGRTRRRDPGSIGNMGRALPREGCDGSCQDVIHTYISYSTGLRNVVLSDWLMGNAANGSTSLCLGETTLLLCRDTMSRVLYYSIISANSSSFGRKKGKKSVAGNGGRRCGIKKWKFWEIEERIWESWNLYVLMFVDNRGIWRIDLNECKNFEWRIMIIDDNYFCVFFFLLCLIYYFSWMFGKIWFCNDNFVQIMDFNFIWNFTTTR